MLEAEQEAALLSELAIQSAKNNSQILSTGQGTSSNFLFDTRDKLIDEISRLAEVTSDLGPQGDAVVKLGSSGVGLDWFRGMHPKPLRCFIMTVRWASL